MPDVSKQPNEFLNTHMSSVSYVSNLNTVKIWAMSNIVSCPNVKWKFLGGSASENFMKAMGRLLYEPPCLNE